MARVRATGSLKPAQKVETKQAADQETKQSKVYLDNSIKDVKDLENAGYIILRDTRGNITEIRSPPAKYITKGEKFINPRTGKKDFKPTNYGNYSPKVYIYRDGQLYKEEFYREERAEFSAGRIEKYKVNSYIGGYVYVDKPSRKTPMKYKRQPEERDLSGLKSSEGQVYRTDLKTGERVVTKSLREDIKPGDVYKPTQQYAIQFEGDQPKTAKDVLQKYQELPKEAQTYETLKQTGQAAERFNLQAQKTKLQKAAIFPQPEEYYNNKYLDLAGMEKKKGEQIINPSDVDYTFTYGETVKKTIPYTGPEMLPGYVVRTAQRSSEQTGMPIDFFLNKAEGTKASTFFKVQKERFKRQKAIAAYQFGIESEANKEGLFRSPGEIKQAAIYAGKAYGQTTMAAAERATEKPIRTAAYFGAAFALGFGSSAFIREGIVAASTLTTVGNVATTAYIGSIAYGTYTAEDKIDFLGARVADTAVFVAGGAAGVYTHKTYVDYINWKRFTYDIERDYIATGEKWRGGDVVFEPDYKYTITDKFTGKTIKTYQLKPLDRGLPIVEAGTGAVLKGRQLQIIPKEVDVYNIKPSAGATVKPSGQTYYSASGLEARGSLPPGFSGVKTYKVPGSISITPKNVFYQRQVLDYVDPRNPSFREDIDSFIKTPEVKPKRGIKGLLKGKGAELTFGKSELDTAYQEDYFYPTDNIITPDKTPIDNIIQTPKTATTNFIFPIVAPYSTNKQESKLGYDLASDQLFNQKENIITIQKPKTVYDFDVENKIILQPKQIQEQIQEQTTQQKYKQDTILVFKTPTPQQKQQTGQGNILDPITNTPPPDCTSQTKRAFCYF